MPFQSDTDRRHALATRDRAADGHFVYAVVTTGVFCRPSCAARPARPENLRFFTDPPQAVAAGYRACKRCRPDQAPRAEREVALVARACRRIEQDDEAPALQDLAAQAGLSPFHFHRVFRRLVGVTPSAYAAACRAGRITRQPGRGRDGDARDLCRRVRLGRPLLRGRSRHARHDPHRLSQRRGRRVDRLRGRARHARPRAGRHHRARRLRHPARRRPGRARGRPARPLRPCLL